MKHKRLWLMLICAMLLLCGCTQNKSGAFDDAVKLFAAGQYAEAAAAFDKVGDYATAPTYAAYSHGLVLYDQGQYSAAEPYFAKVRSFMYGEERYQYCHAHALLEQGQFAQAGEAFRAMGEFEDAALQAEYCFARDAEISKRYDDALYGYQASVTLHDAEDRLYNLQGQLYNRAIALKKEGNYQDAITLFTMLGDYLSAAAQAVECKTIHQEQQYALGDEYEASGDLQSAYTIFSALSGYRDAADRAEQLGLRLGIDLPDHEGIF